MSSALPPYTPLQEDSEDFSPPVPVNPDRGHYAQQWPAAMPVYYPAAVAAPPPASQTVVINQAAPMVVQPIQRYQSFSGYICLSCFVFWCCGCFFGFIAFILAMFARDKSVIAPQSARRLGVASLLFSIIGIIVGIIAIVLIIVLFVVYGVHRSAETYQSTCSEYLGGDC